MESPACFHEMQPVTSSTIATKTNMYPSTIGGINKLDEAEKRAIYARYIPQDLLQKFNLSNLADNRELLKFHFVSGSIYYGFMDMTYFSFTPRSLQDRKLKIAIVFIHDAFRFEVWLGGYNKQVQQKYWELFKKSDWNKYHIVATTKGVDSILEHVLVDDPDFSDPGSFDKTDREDDLEIYQGY